MAHGVKYRLEYYRLHGGQTTIDILERSYAGAVTALTGASDPLQIKWDGDFNNLYSPTIGSGATIKLVSTPLALLNLYTNDPQKYIVKIYNGVSGSTLRWQGFINAEVYSEGYSNPIYSEITLQCNDGMQLLDNISYLNSDGTYIEENEILYLILTNVFNKLEIDFVDMYMNHSLLVDELVDQILGYLKLPQENFVDESGEAMSCRAVLDSVLGGLGLVMFFSGSYVYLYDPIDLHNFTQGSWVGLDSDSDYSVAVDSHTAITDYLDIANGDLPWGETGSTLDIVPELNEIVVKYDPYNYEGFDANFGLESNIDTVGSFIDLGDYYFNGDSTYKNWVLSSGFTYGICGIEETTDDAPIYCLVLEDGKGTATLPVPLSNISSSPEFQIKLSMDVYVQTTEDSLDIYVPTGTATTINFATIPIRIKVGDTYILGDAVDFAKFYVIENDMSYTEIASDPTQSIINDTWTSVSKTMNFSTSVRGQIQLEILDDIYQYFESQVYPNSANYPGDEKIFLLMLKNIRIEIINKITGDAIGNNGIEDKVVLSTNLTGKKKYEISLTTGSGPYGCSRGAFENNEEFYPSQANIFDGLYRAPYDSSSVRYSTPKLLLQSMMSQYQSPRFRLNGTFDVTNASTDLRIQLIKDTGHLGSRAFYFIGGTYNDREETLNAELLELEDTREAVT